MHPKDKATILEVAQEQHEVSLAYVQCAEDRWQHAITLLETTVWDDPVAALKAAMDADPVVVHARAEAVETADLLTHAQNIAKES